MTYFAVPEEVPKNVSLSAAKNEILATWLPLPDDIDVWNSLRKQYKCNLTEATPFSSFSYSVILTLYNITNITIPSLEETQWYMFQVAAITDTGDGNFTEPVCIRTKEAGILSFGIYTVFATALNI